MKKDKSNRKSRPRGKISKNLKKQSPEITYTWGRGPDQLPEGESSEDDDFVDIFVNEFVDSFVKTSCDVLKNGLYIVVAGLVMATFFPEVLASLVTLFKGD